MNCSKIICIGQNYPAHAREMDLPSSSNPVIFLKPPSSLITDGEVIEAPAELGRVDYEVELALIIGKRAKHISEKDALSYISMVATFNDITARDVQANARDSGHPWTFSKGLDTFAPMSVPVELSSVGDIHDLDLELCVNGKLRQHGNTADMLFSPEKLVAYISTYMTLEEGDIIATGTPEGVSGLNDGDFVEASISGVGKVSNHVKRI
ncbi:MAG: fumarylacetoacetate hydrolase family protein [Euryarchaeota archaeon]|nr:fumarylacetoacetate hydrolase family protein [Euryarchaeota archaeon]